MNIEERSQRSLEWDRLTNYLAVRAETACAAALLKVLVPEACTPEQCEALLAETEEALALIESRTAPKFAGLIDVLEPLALLAAGGTVSAVELVNIRTLLTTSRLTRSSLALLAREDFPLLFAFALKLISLKEEERALGDALEGDGTVKDDATSELLRLRREVKRLEGKIRAELSNIINANAATKALQEPLFTMRGGRYVLPVNASNRSQVQGIVHDASQSGLTVYVEPLSVVELTNQIRIKESEIASEIERILSHLSEILRPHAQALKESFHTLIALDCIFARAKLSLALRGSRPEIANSVDRAGLALVDAKHPLLILQDVDAVGNDVFLKAGERTLIITGPNTGGKTVLLKQIGLFALMVRAGLFLPVKAGSRLPYFASVCADIGDEQSLEQSLSTFSAHMKNVVEIVGGAGPSMLVLLDEIGAGTDPKEGWALSQSVLEYLHGHGATTIATTHLGELKTLAYSREGFVNGSFQFDDATLSPTYKLRLGVPGSSKASTIARRLGLNSQVVERAEELVAQSANEIDLVVQNLDRRGKELTVEIEAARSEKEAAQLLSLELARENEKIKESKGRLLESEKARLEAEFEEATRLIRETVKNLQQTPNLARAEEARLALSKIKKELWPQTALPAKQSGEFSEGQLVKVLGLGKTGVVKELILDSKGVLDKLLVQVGSMRVKLSPSELTAAGKEPQSKLSARQAKLLSTVKSGNFGQAKRGQELSVFVRTQANTLDLRGKRVDEAEGELDSFVDGCINSSISPFMIIHGHGTGAIKSLVRTFLQDSPYQVKFRPGESFEGGDGVTVVEIV